MKSKIILILTVLFICTAVLPAQILINGKDTCMCFTPAEVRKSDKIRDERNYLKEQNKDLQGQNDTLKLYVQDLKSRDSEKNNKIVSLNDFINMQSKHIIEIENKPTQTIVEKRAWYEIPAYTTAGITVGILLKLFLIK